MWTPIQRGVLTGFVLVVSTVLLVRLALNRSYIPDPPPAQGAHANDPADQLDPNTATWQELAVLPQLGEKRANEIIAYRDSHSGVAFKRAEDLSDVKGIGPAMIETLRPH